MEVLTVLNTTFLQFGVPSTLENKQAVFISDSDSMKALVCVYLKRGTQVFASLCPFGDTC